MHVLRQQLFGALIGLSRASESKEILDSSGMALIHGLSLAYDPVWEDSDKEISDHMEAAVNQAIQTLHTEKALMAPDCAACQTWRRPWNLQRLFVTPNCSSSLYSVPLRSHPGNSQRKNSVSFFLTHSSRSAAPMKPVS